MKPLKSLPFGIFGKLAPKKPARKGKSELAIQLELAVRQKREAERKAAELQREIEAIPQKIRKLEKEQQRKIKERASRMPTMQGLGRPVHKLHSVSERVKLTRAQERILRNRLIMLCALFAVVLLVLWRSVR
jgi:Flp pilus assembly protein TadB